MAETRVKGRDVGDTSIYREDLNISTSGKAVITKILEKANSGIKLSSSTGADAGTGDVEITIDPSLPVDETAPFVMGFSASGVPVKKTAFANTIQNRIVEVKVNSSALTVGNIKGNFFIPEELNGAKIVKVEACVTSVGTVGLTTIDIYNVTTGFPVTSTSITIDINEKTSYTAATRSAIWAGRELVYSGTEICCNVLTVATGAAGLSYIVTFEK